MHVLHISNLLLDTTEDKIRDLLAPYGTVTQVDVAAQLAIGQCNARVDLDAAIDPPALLIKVEHLTLGDRRVLITPAQPTKSALRADLSAKQTALADEIAEQMGETEKGPRKQIMRIITLCGEPFIRASLAETKEIEATGGLITKDGTRRRSPGGTFFFLAKQHMSSAMRQAVFPYRPKKKAKRKQAKTGVEKPKPAPTKSPVTEVVKEPTVAPEPVVEVEPATLADLRHQLQHAQLELDAIRAGVVEGSLMTAMKCVLDVQRQIDALGEKAV